MKTLALRTFLCNTSSITRLSNKVWGATSITKFSAHSPMRHTINRCPFAWLSHKNNGPATVDHMRLCVLRLASHPSGVTIHASRTKSNSATIFLPADCRTQVNRTIVFTIRPSPSVTIIIRHKKKTHSFLWMLELLEATMYVLVSSSWITKSCHLVFKNTDHIGTSSCILTRGFPTSCSATRMRIT